MRTRTSTTPFTIPVGDRRYQRWDSVPPPSKDTNALLENIFNTTPVYTDNTYDSLITIVDEDNKLRMEKYCKHTKRVLTVQIHSELKFEQFDGPYLVRQTVHGGYYAYTYMRTRMSNLEPSMGFKPIDWRSLSFESLEAMRPKFSNLSLVEDVAELHQLRNLCKPFGGLRSQGPTVTAANFLLWMKYGVKQTLESIHGVYELMSSMKKTIANLRKRAKRLQTRHFAHPYLAYANEFPVDSVIYSENSGIYALKLSRRCRWVDYPKYHATMKFRYDIGRLSDIELELRAWSEAFGFNSPIGTIWNLIPYSFVIDWFVNIGEWAESLLREPAIPIVIEDFSHSVKYSYRTDIDLSDWNGKLTTPIASGEIHYYERKREIPSKYAPLRFSWPGAEQILMGSALVVQAAVPDEPRIGARERKPRHRWVASWPTGGQFSR